MTLYLKNARFVNWETFEIKSVNIKINSSSVDFIDNLPKSGQDNKIIDCRDKLVTKSLGCGHHHIYSTLARGMPAPKKIPVNFKEILEYVWWHLDKRLDKKMIEASALAAAVHCAKNGVTLVIDHHASPFAVEDSLEIIADAFDKVGISHLLCYELSDRDGKKSREAGLLEHEKYLSSGRQGHIGLHASFTVSDDLLKRAVEMAHKFDTGIHIHVAEDKADQDDCVKDYGMRVVKRLYKAGALDLPKTILIHCVHLDEEEKKLIRTKGTWIVENIESNQNNNVGQADYNSITDKIMLGTDGMHGDMIRSAKAAFFAGQRIEKVSMAAVYDRFRNIHRYIKESGFKGDGDNNLVILNYDSPTEVTSENFLGHFLFGIESKHVEYVISNGRLIVEKGKVISVNEDDIFAYSREMGIKLWEKMTAS